MVWHFVRQAKQSKHAVSNCAATHIVRELEYIIVIHSTLLLGTDFRSNRLRWNISFVRCPSWYSWISCNFYFCIQICRSGVYIM